MSDALILAKLDTLEGLVRQLLAGNGVARSAPAAKTNGQRSGGNVAGDDDLDSDKGDPKIVYDPKSPKYWEGASYVGLHYSEVPDPAYLDAMAKYLDASAYAAGKSASEGKDVKKNEKAARYKAIDAGRARGWAKRIRERVAAAPKPSPADADYGGGGNDDDIPFAPPFDLGA